MANLSASGLSKFRRWYAQYKAIHGMEPPQDMMNSYLAAEMDAESANMERSRQTSLQEKQVGLQEKSIDYAKDYQDKSLAQRQTEFGQTFAQNQLAYNQNLKMQKEQLKAQEQASMVSGVKDLATLGMEGYRTFGGGGKAAATPSYSGGLSMGGSGVKTGLDLSQYGSYGSTTGLGSSEAANSAINLSRYSGYGSDAGVSFDAGSSFGSSGAGGAGVGTGGINWGGAARGLGTAAAVAAIDYTREPVKDYMAGSSRRYGTEGAKAADVSSYIGQGALIGSKFGGLGAAIGAVAGAEYGGARASGYGLSSKESAKQYNESGGVAALFGITAGQIETKQDSSSIKAAKAVLTGGMSKVASKIKKKLKKWF